MKRAAGHTAQEGAVTWGGRPIRSGGRSRRRSRQDPAARASVLPSGGEQNRSFAAGVQSRADERLSAAPVTTIRRRQAGATPHSRRLPSSHARARSARAGRSPDAPVDPASVATVKHAGCFPDARHPIRDAVETGLPGLVGAPGYGGRRAVERRRPCPARAATPATRPTICRSSRGWRRCASPACISGRPTAAA